MPKYEPLTKSDLRERIKEIEDRIKAMDRREKLVDELKKWMEQRKLTPIDVQFMVRQLKPKRAKKPVTSTKKVLEAERSVDRPLRSGNGLILHNGKLVPAKGDPEFRRRMVEARQKAGLSTKEFGRKIGVSDATVSSWEAGRYVPSEENRAKVVKALELPAGLGAAASKAMEEGRGS